MSDFSIKYAYTLDDIRRQKKISVSNLCEGICSDRQYRRFMSGERILSQEKIYIFCEKLGVSPGDFFYASLSKDKYDYRELYVLYSYLLNHQFEKFLIQYEKIKKTSRLDKQNQRFYDFNYIKYTYLTKKITKLQAVDQFSTLVDYPNCVNNNVFDFVDVICLFDISAIESEFKDSNAMDILLRILYDKSLLYIGSESRHILPSIYRGVSQMLLLRKNYKESLKLSNEGIAYCLKFSDLQNLSGLYFAKSISNSKLGYKKEAHIAAARTIGNSIAMNDTRLINDFSSELKEELGTDPFEFFNIYRDDLLKNESR